MSMKNNNKYKTIIFEVKRTPYLDSYVRECSEYRHILYNIGVYKILENEKRDGFISCDKNWLNRFIYHNFETLALLDKPYDYFVRGIRECVVDDISTTVSKVITARSKGLSSDIRQTMFDSNSYSFRIKNKMKKGVYRNKDGILSCCKVVLTEDPHIIGIKVNKTKDALGLYLYESIIDSMKRNDWSLNDICEIYMKFHNEKLFVGFKIKYNPFKLLVDKRLDMCGIDLGETSPVVLYDGQIIRIPKHLQYPKDAIKKYNRKIENCKRIMDRKYNKDLADAGLPQSKRYYKVLRKFHKYWERHNNILKDWQFKLAHWIVTHYKNIVLDEFHEYIIKVTSQIKTVKRKKLNKGMRHKSMAIFTKRLIHMAHKYGTNYFKVIKNDRLANVNKPIFETTNTCCLCGNVNIHKLDINKRIFKCESCGYTIDRDVNAAINCYNLYKNKSTRKLFLELI